MSRTKSLTSITLVVTSTFLIVCSLILFAGCGNTVKIRFNLNYNGATNSIKAITIEKETAVDDNEDVKWPANPTRDNFTFLGWYANTAGTGEAYTSASEIDKTITLYAKWQSNTSPRENSGDDTGNTVVPPDNSEHTYGDFTYMYNEQHPDTVKITRYNGSSEVVTIPETINDKNVTIISNGIFTGKNIEGVVILAKISTIGQLGFRGKWIVIPNSVNSISNSAFPSSNLKKVYFAATEEWTISVNESGDAGNVGYRDSDKYYYSASRPTTAGNYWHYDSSGMPQVWP